MSRPFSAVVSTWNCEKTVRRCLRALIELEPQDIIVVDLGSSDRTTTIVAEEFADVQLVHSGSGESFAAARNAGLARSAGRFVLFVDGDWLADSISLDRLISELDRTPHSAAAVPRFMDDSGNSHVGHNIRRFPTAESFAAEFLMMHKIVGSQAVRKHRMLDFDHASDIDIDHPCGCFVLARRQALIEAGGYDETFEGAWMEDIDLAQRLRQLGWSSRFCSSAHATHVGRETIRHFFIEHHYDAYYRSVLRYSERYLTSYYNLIRACLLAGLVSKAAFSYAVPAGIRSWVLRQLGLYNSDDAIRGYRRMYLRAIQVVHAMSGPC